MQRRRFGKHDFQVSALGFGMMRLPVLDQDQSKIDEEKTRELVHYAVDHGVNYIDTAYNYHGGQSEVVVGKILRKGLRDKVYLATKCPTWLVKTRDDFDRLLAEQLQKLQTDHIDMYLLHALNKDRWKVLLEANVFDFLSRAKADGRIMYAGFSFHDDVNTFKSIVDSFEWDFCQIQYNYMDERAQAGTEGLKYAASKNLAVVVMEPLRGGKLAQNVPTEVKAVWDKSGVKREPAEWGLRWVWNHPEVTVVLSGMNTMEQLRENIRTAETALPNSLSSGELALFDEVKRFYRSRVRISCTSCRYCSVCPQSIKIAELFSIYNDACMFGSREGLKRNYEQLKKNLGDPASCLECGQCEQACPQRLPIKSFLKQIDAELRGE